MLKFFYTIPLISSFRDENKPVVISIVLTSILFIIFVILNSMISSPAWNAALSAIFISLMVTLLYAIPERMGLVRSTHVHISDTVEIVAEKVENILQTRLTYGLARVIKKLDEDDLLSKLSGKDKVRWNNTKINFNEREQAIYDAVSRGVDIKILLLSSESPIAKYRYHEIHDPDEVDEYIKELKLQESKARRLMERCVELKGSLKIKFYDGLPSVPIFIVNQHPDGSAGENKKSGHKEVYTGFFLHKISSAAPYLVWETALDDPFLVDLEIYFDHRWEKVSSAQKAPTIGK